MSVFKQQSPNKLVVKDGNSSISVYGLFVYQGFAAGANSARAFLREFQSGKARFDDCIGSYRVMIAQEKDSRIYFCDNSGSMCYFIRESSAEFFDMLSMAMPVESRRPNYSAIAQFLYFGCIYGVETIVQGVQRSDPDCYYEVIGGHVVSKSKELTPLEEIATDENALANYMRRMTQATTDYKKTGCVITGGTDSRAILSHLEHQNVHPYLSITGAENHVDVQIAHQLAGLLHESLTVISDMPEGNNWLDEAITAADGMAGACGIYRLYKKAKSLNLRDIPIEYGGIAGELYKNSFINQDFPLYVGAPNWKRFFKMKIAAYDFPQVLCGKNIAEEMLKIPETMLGRLMKASGKNKANAYLTAGYDILRAGAIAVSNMNAQWYFPCNPLLEREVVAQAFHKNPYALEMQAYQRNQVSLFCPDIKNVKTDRGLTCNNKRKAIEWAKSMLFLVKVGLTRIFKRKTVFGRVDACFAAGFSSPLFVTAMKKCQTLGILSQNTPIAQIPQGIADRLLTVGSFFTDSAADR